MKIYKILVSILIMLTFTACSEKRVDNIISDKEGINIIIATDTHYISQNLVEEGTILDNLHYNGDGKIFKYTEEITEAFIDDVIEDKPDILIISGDLTFNGEKESHEEFAKKLHRVEEAGISVLVTPGNHDINNFYASKINSNTIERVDRVNAKDFKKIYAELGYDTAAYEDRNSLSYITKATESLWIFMIDSNIYESNSKANPSESGGEISDKTLKWLDKHLALAEEEGVEVITVTHHNLVDHNSTINFKFTINNNEELIALLDKYGVKLNLTGHIHVQDIKQVKTDNGTITDISTSALGVYNNQYGVIEYIPNKEIRYNTKEVDVERWAKENNIQDNNLLNFEEYSENFFSESSRGKAVESLSGYIIPEEELKILSEFVGKLNPAYFAGKLDSVYNELINSEGYRLWEEAGNIGMKGYIDSILNGEIKDQNSIVIELN